jgi:hypothetical protein
MNVLAIAALVCVYMDVLVVQAFMHKSFYVHVNVLERAALMCVNVNVLDIAAFVCVYVNVLVIHAREHA